MEEREFVAGSRETWSRLADSTAQARRIGVSRMGAPALRQMHEDYRRTAADLAYAQTHFPGSESADHLNRLVGQAHGELYGSAPRRLAAIWRFLSAEYPALLRENWRPIALAAALLVGAAIVGAILTYTDPQVARLLLPEVYREAFSKPSIEPADQEMMAAVAPGFAAYIGVNNVQVALLAFAGGMTAGALTVYAMLTNGAMLGVLAAMYEQAGLSLPFWALIVPHGALELPAIFIAGAAGLRMASAIILPRDEPRPAALKAAAAVAVRLLLGTIPLFIIASIIEGFFTPSGAGQTAKLVAGGLAGIALAAYWAFGGRTRTAR